MLATNLLSKYNHHKNLFPDEFSWKGFLVSIENHPVTIKNHIVTVENVVVTIQISLVTI